MKKKKRKGGDGEVGDAVDGEEEGKEEGGGATEVEVEETDLSRAIAAQLLVPGFDVNTFVDKRGAPMLVGAALDGDVAAVRCILGAVGVDVDSQVLQRVLAD